MTERSVLTLAIHTPPPSHPKFARKHKAGYQYGYVITDQTDRKKDVYKILGTAPTIEEAMRLNGMDPLEEPKCFGESLAA